MNRSLLLGLLFLPVSMAQPPVDPSPAVNPLDELLGQTVPPAVAAVSTALGQNLTREDVRLFADINVTKGEITPLGFVIGSGNVELTADVYVRGELRVISSERIRAAIQNENPYALDADNATFLTQLFIPAEVFRATLAAEVVAAFQAEEERALRDFLSAMVPELSIVGLEISWSNTNPLLVVTDLSLSEPPIVVELHAQLHYVRVESVGNLLKTYFESQEDKDEGKADYIERVKNENGAALKSRDFYGAAAYTQLLNVSMQPGWSLDVSLSVPRGYSFEYTSAEVDKNGPRALSFRVDGDDTSEEDPFVLLASITHRRAVAMALFGAMWLAGLVLITVPAVIYTRKRLARHGTKMRPREIASDTSSPAVKSRKR